MKEVYEIYLEGQFARLNELSEKQYEGAAKSYEATYGRFMPADKNSKILDIGCGAGHFLFYLKKKGYTNYHGIDISKQQVDFVQQNITENVELADTFEFLDDKEKLYDLIIVNDLLEHISKEKIIKFLKLVYNSLKNDGILIIKVPNMSNPFGLRARYIDITHEVGFTENSLYAVLKAVSFNNICIYPADYPISSIKSFVGRIIRKFVHTMIKYSYRVQGYGAPKILAVNIIGVAKKEQSHLPSNSL